MSESVRAAGDSAYFQGAEFSDQEIALLADGSPFRLRSKVMERMEQSLGRLRERLRMQLRGGSYLRPDHADLGEGKLGRGDHLEEMPYAFLDLPRCYGEDTLFTFRTLFWWGHEVSFSLLLAGPHLSEYRQRLLQNLSILEALDVHISTADTPWDWHRGPGHTLHLSGHEAVAVQRLFRSQAFLKCTRYLEFETEEFRQDRLEEAALLTFRALEPLILV